MTLWPKPPSSVYCCVSVPGPSPNISFPVPKMEESVLTYISCMDTAYVRENFSTPKIAWNKVIWKPSILGTTEILGARYQPLSMACSSSTRPSWVSWSAMPWAKFPSRPNLVGSSFSGPGVEPRGGGGTLGKPEDSGREDWGTFRED